jgi:hypothetical protein
MRRRLCGLWMLMKNHGRAKRGTRSCAIRRGTSTKRDTDNCQSEGAFHLYWT